MKPLLGFPDPQLNPDPTTWPPWPPPSSLSNGRDRTPVSQEEGSGCAQAPPAPSRLPAPSERQAKQQGPWVPAEHTVGLRTWALGGREHSKGWDWRERHPGTQKREGQRLSAPTPPPPPPGPGPAPGATSTSSFSTSLSPHSHIPLQTQCTVPRLPWGGVITVTRPCGVWGRGCGFGAPSPLLPMEDSTCPPVLEGPLGRA